MTKLLVIEYLKVNKILGANGTLLFTTDGCAAQYRSATFSYLLSALAVSHGILSFKGQFRFHKFMDDEADRMRKDVQSRSSC